MDINIVAKLRKETDFFAQYDEYDAKKCLMETGCYFMLFVIMILIQDTRYKIQDI